VTRASSASSAEPSGGAGERAVLWAVALACVLVPLNSTMLAVALPRIVDDLDTTLGAASWLVTSYLIAMASLQPVAGKLGDRFGRRPLMLGGLVWFAAASAGAAAADGVAVLVAFRLQQAVAGALMFPNAMALLREVVPAGRLGSRLGLVGAAIMLGAAAGPPIGGVLLAAGGWRWTFLVNLPLVALGLTLAWRAVPRRPARAGAGGFDRVGAVLLSVALGSGAWALTGAAVVAPLAVVLLVAFVAVELRRPDPVVQPRLFAQRSFSAAAAGVALSNLSMYVTLLALPVMLERRGGLGSAAIGLVLASLSAAALVVTPAGGRICDRLGPAAPATAGLAVQGLSLVPLALWPSTLPVGSVVACLVAAGAGLGLASSALQVAAVSAVDVGAAGVASGVFSTSRYAGSIVGTALLAGPLAPSAVGFGALFAVLACAAGGAALAATGLGGRRSAGQPQPEPAQPRAAGAALAQARPAAARAR
jgi:EmrB/QacA subfamily drug resistance transporter